MAGKRFSDRDVGRGQRRNLELGHWGSEGSEDSVSIQPSYCLLQGLPTSPHVYLVYENEKTDVAVTVPTRKRTVWITPTANILPITMTFN
jgi:hypothetical protein